jgi:hypothetical protein
VDLDGGNRLVGDGAHACGGTGPGAGPKIRGEGSEVVLEHSAQQVPDLKLPVALLRAKENEMKRFKNHVLVGSVFVFLFAYWHDYELSPGSCPKPRPEWRSGNHPKYLGKSRTDYRQCGDYRHSHREFSSWSVRTIQLASGAMVGVSNTNSMPYGQNIQMR